MNTYTQGDLVRAKRFGQCTNTPAAVYFDDWLVSSAGAGFELYREPHHTDLDIARAEKWLRAERDVVTLRIAKPATERHPATQLNAEIRHGHHG